MFDSRNLRSVVVVATAALLAAGCDKAPEATGDGPKMEFVRIPAGSFYMGSPASERDRDDNEGPVHEVRITKPFYMGKYEVTQAQWKAVMGITLSQQHDKAKSPWLLKGEGPEYPMYYVSWEEAVEFCKKLGRRFRLPTEAEWEYACRAESQTRFYYGDDPNYSELDLYAWHAGNSDNTTHPVGQKTPNAWGLYDMYGNVSEWCSDWFAWLGGYKNAGSVDPTGPASGVSHVHRSASWCTKAQDCRSSGRNVDFWGDLIGFRVVFAGNIRGDEDILEIALPQETGKVVFVPEQEREDAARSGLTLAGVVRDEASVPIDDVAMQIVPGREWFLRAYPNGRFEAVWHPETSNAPMRGYRFLGQHTQRNLAAIVGIDEDANSLDIKLEPGAILSGKVVDGDGKGIGGAQVVTTLQHSDWRANLLPLIVETDVEGRFTVRALPLGHRFVLSGRSAGYRTGRIEVLSGDVRDNRIDVGPMVLMRGDLSVSGVVVDTNGKPVADLGVYCFGQDQPGSRAVTDADGRFTLDGIFKGQVKIMAGGSKLYGYADAEAGATDVKVVLDNQGMPPPKGRTCFPADTQVWVNGERVPISQVAEGQTVFRPAFLMAGKPCSAAAATSFGQVEDVEEHCGAFECRDIVFENGNHIRVVGAHCFMLDSGQWIAAQDLRSGLRLKTLDGTVAIRSVRIRATPFIGNVCNLKIENSDRYAVGQDGVIVRDY